MKKLKSTISYYVPSWDFCNKDVGLLNDVSNTLCRFCTKVRGKYVCLLHDETLDVESGLVCKATACNKKSAAEIDIAPHSAPTPIVPPQELIKQTLNIYTQTVRDLVKQGYPQQIAENVARKNLTGE